MSFSIPSMGRYPLQANHFGHMAVSLRLWQPCEQRDRPKRMAAPIQTTWLEWGRGSFSEEGVGTVLGRHTTEAP